MKKPRILVVDDDAESQELYVEILQWAGFDVCTAGDGFSAIEAAAVEQPHAVLLDIEMPRKDGLAVLSELRSLPSTALIPVIALTGFADAADRARISGGFAQVLEKPCDPKSLVNALRLTLRRSPEPRV
jgi:two-component system, sensor histidine kinase and response regulator